MIQICSFNSFGITRNNNLIIYPQLIDEGRKIMKNEIKLLVLEDAEEDFKMIERILRKAGMQFQTRLVDTKDEYVEALQHYHADVILSDHSLPKFNSGEALSILKNTGVRVPFIIVTGNVSEEFAVQCIKQGVDDYVLKSNIGRLPDAIQSALKHQEDENLYTKTLRDLEENNKTLVKYNKELESFVNNVSKNLRAPLSSMLNVIHLIKGQDGNDDELANYFEMMEQSITKLDETLQEFQHHNPKAEITVEPIDLSRLIEEQIEGMKFLPGAASIVKDVSTDERHAFFSDLYHVSVIINNLISNAIKYHDPKKTDPFIKISIEVDSKKAVLEIQDNGIGIDDKYLSKVFDMFFRATHKNEGAGLGLHLVKESVDKLHGKLSVNSRLGYGTLFTIELPNHTPVAQTKHDTSNRFEAAC